MESVNEKIVSVSGILRSHEGFLLIQRDLSVNNRGGTWEIPGGKADMGGDLKDAIKREYEEETGLDIQPTSVLGYIDDIFENKGQTFHIIYIIFEVQLAKGESLDNIQLSEEHSDYQFMSYQEMMESSDNVDKRLLKFFEENMQIRKLVEEFEFEDFQSALDFVNKVGELAEEANHHPDITMHDWNQVRVELITHEKGYVTEKDSDLMKQIKDLK